MIEKILQLIWYDCRFSFLKYLLAPFSLIYFFIILTRKKLYHYKFFNSYKSQKSVIVVGNINVGGCGKTPMVMAIAQLLLTKNCRPAIILRGYKGSLLSKAPYNKIIMVNEQHTAVEVGDEAKLHFNKFYKKDSNIPIIISKSKVAAVQYIEKYNLADVIISDDGLQHYALTSDIKICMIDGRRFLGNKWLLPAGPLRDSKKVLQNVDYILSKDSHDYFKKDEFYSFYLQPMQFYACHSQQEFSLAEMQKMKLILVTAIANSPHFERTLKKLKLNIMQSIIFSDHHNFTVDDFSRINIEFDGIIMTEKDAVKCTAFLHNKIYCLAVWPQISSSFYDSIWNKLTKLQ